MQYSFNKTAVIYSQENCPACAEAKTILELAGYKIEVRMLGEGGTATKQRLLQDFPDARSVPQIILNDNKVGNLNSLKEFFKVK